MKTADREHSKTNFIEKEIKIKASLEENNEDLRKSESFHLIALQYKQKQMYSISVLIDGNIHLLATEANDFTISNLLNLGSIGT